MIACFSSISKRALRDCADLRNLMSHNPLHMSHFVVEPSEELLEELENILKKLQNVKRLDAFKKNIRLFSETDKLSEALHYMHANDFSQIVIYQENTNLQLLTVEGITRWLGKQVEQDLISLKDATIGEALAEDLLHTFKIMRRDQLIDDAWSTFAEAIETGSHRIYAIIVTQNGLPTEKPLTIITPWDIIE
jgi:predicted transcriptional regulator